MSTDLPPLRLGFAGTPEFAVPALDALRRVHTVCAVFTQPDRPAGRGQPLHQSPVKALATHGGLTVHQPASFKSPGALETLRGLRLDALVVAAYGLILPPAALQCPKLGCINIHASLLPRWRGAAPIQHAILAGDTETGITIMRMEARLDTGPMLASQAIEIGAHDTAKTLHDRLARLGAELICGTLDALVQGRAREVPQPSEGITYAEKITKAEALIDWHQDAVQVWRRIRAFNPWPIAETRLSGAQVRIWEAETRKSAPGAVPGTVLAATHDGIDVACGSGVLRILRLQLAGRKPLLAKEFIKSQRLEGVRFAQV
ncbi:MAG TPA: methionyl-tRNA formyltransferase [Steroidobacteraceae bacterium]|nr:methionyl-tRNA formyltransferase [Steroidobacteraceae bacterium]